MDLLLTDVVMPLMRGTELAQRLLAVVPSAKVLLMSAYKVAEIAASGHPFLAKPFTPDVLLGAGPRAPAGRALAVRAAAPASPVGALGSRRLGGGAVGRGEVGPLS